MIFSVKRLHNFLYELGACLSVLRGCVILCVERLCDFLCGEVS